MPVPVPRLPRAIPTLTNEGDIVAFLKRWQSSFRHLLRRPTPPARVPNFTATGLSTGILLEWGSVRSADGFEIIRADTADFSGETVSTLIRSNKQRALFDAVPLGTTRHYKIRATSGTTSEPQTIFGALSFVVSATSGNPIDDSPQSLVLEVNVLVSGSANSHEAVLYGLSGGVPDRSQDGRIVWDGQTITIERLQGTSGVATIYTSDDDTTSKGWICFDTAKTKPFTGISFPSRDVAFVRRVGTQWQYDNQNTGGGAWTNFTPTAAMVALGWLTKGASGIADSGLYGAPVALAVAPEPGVESPIGRIGELVRNPNFEGGDRDWTLSSAFSIVNEPANAYDGNWVLRLDHPAGPGPANNAPNDVFIAVVPGDRLLAQCMIKRVSGNALVSVRIMWFDSSKVHFASSTGTGITSSSFVQSRVVGTAPSGAAFAKVACKYDTVSVAGTAYFDQFGAAHFPLDADELPPSPTREFIEPTYVDSSRRPIRLRRTNDDLPAADIFRFQGTGLHTLDNAADGSTYNRVRATAVTGGEVDLSKAGVIQKVLDNITDSSTRKARTAAHSSYRPLSNPLTATDAGATATVNVAAFTMRSAGVDISLNSGSVSSLSFDTLYFIYYDDAGFAGGSVTYNATTVKETALNGSGRFFVGSIFTPKDSGPDTVGFNDGGTGAQNGRAIIGGPAQPNFTSSGGSPPTWANRGNILDGDQGSKGVLTGTGTSQAKSATETLSNFSAPSENYKSLVLKVRTQVPTNNLNGTDPNVADISYSLNGGISFTNLWSVGAGTTRGLSTDSVSLGTRQNPAAIQVRISMAIDTTATTGSVVLDFYEAWVEGVI